MTDPAGTLDLRAGALERNIFDVKHRRPLPLLGLTVGDTLDHPPHCKETRIPRPADLPNTTMMKHFSLSQQWILAFLALLMLGLLYFRFYHTPLPSPPEEVYREVVIEVAGEVRTPGIQLFREAPTLQSVLEKAGGLGDASPQGNGSLSERLETGTVVTVARKTSLKGSSNEIRLTLGRMEAKKLIVFSIPLNLNRVSAEDLCLVPGIGEPLAREIVTYRDRRRGFRSVEELKNIKGIGNTKWNAIRTYFTVE